MITEDYISFETARLLKEKGFDAECDYLYVDGELVRARGGKSNWNKGETLFTDYKNECSAPTLQMVMKWLREVHNIFIQVELYSKYDDYCFELFQNTHRLIMEKREVYNTYEEACESAIKYCFENLI